MTEQSACSDKIPVAIAHRGGAAYHRENSLEACRQAIKRGAHYLEVDVRQTRDGKLVLVHDSWWWSRVENNPYTPSQTLFTDFLNLAATAPVKIFPEIKGTTPGLPQAIIAAIKRSGMLARCVIASFSSAALEEVNQLQPDLPLCQLLYPWQFGSLPALGSGVSFVSPMAETLCLYPDLIHQAHKQDLQVWPWFIFLEVKPLIKLLLQQGVDGLILNDPAAILHKHPF